MTRIRWIDEDQADEAVAASYERIRARHGIDFVPDIYKTMSLRPDLLAALVEATDVHFTEGALTQAQHELIASYVSALNRCHY